MTCARPFEVVGWAGYREVVSIMGKGSRFFVTVPMALRAIVNQHPKSPRVAGAA
jgi:hypothetical protein